MASDWRSADALRDRGLLMIDDDSAVGGGSGPAEPAKPRRPYSERPVARARRAKAQELIDRLVAEGRGRITDSDDEVAEWRRVVNYAKRHGLEPTGGLHGLDHGRITVDLRHLQEALETSRNDTHGQRRRTALERVVELYSGDFASNSHRGMD
ncbi:hypothetical protein [Streptomyces sp. NPDC048385]|uniref:hypothetical protein n=1 Tax=unclassified Streptomyces TaxID=2593676 RepID=UPI00343873FB